MSPLHLYKLKVFCINIEIFVEEKLSNRNDLHNIREQ